MPTTSPARSTSGPPELPGLIAASVWMAGYVVSWPACPSASGALPTDTGRFRALTMPLVTVASRPNGEPIATTFSPTATCVERPIVAGVQAGHAVGLDHGEVGQRVGADDGRLLGGAVVEVHRDLAALPGDRDHVVVGEDLAVGADDDAGPGALLLLALAR